MTPQGYESDKTENPVDVDVSGLEKDSSVSMLAISSFPNVVLLRGETERYETIQFTPKSLMTILVYNTGKNSMASVTMKDNMGQIRYSSSSGGNDHEYVTRLQNTRSYGKWAIVINGFMIDEQTKFELEIPFFVVKKVDPELKETLYVPSRYEVSETEDDAKEEDLQKDVDTIIEPIPADTKPGSLLNEVIEEEINEAGDLKASLKIIHKKPENVQKQPDQDHETSEDFVPKGDHDEEAIIEKELESELSVTDAENSHELDEHRDTLEEEQVNNIEPLEEDVVESGQEVVAGGDISYESPEDIGEGGSNDDSELLEDIDAGTDEVTGVEEMDDEAQLPDHDTYLSELMEGVDRDRLELVRELFITIDDAVKLTNDQLNSLNDEGIVFIDQFLTSPLEVLTKALAIEFEEVKSLHNTVINQIKNESSALLKFYNLLGRIEDKTLAYSTESVEKVYGLGKVTASKFEDSGISDLTALANSNLKEISDIVGISIKKSAEYLVQAKAFVYSRVNIVEHGFEDYFESWEFEGVNPSSQLDIISGIDLSVMNELYGFGINNIGKLISSDIVDLSSKLEKAHFVIASWIVEAQIKMKNRVNLQYRLLEAQ